MFAIRKKIARTAKRAGLLTGGLLLCCVGTGFLTVSAWLGLAPVVGAQLTATIIAGAYLGVGFILIGFASFKTAEPEKAPRQSQPNPPDSLTIIQAFMTGMNAGSKANRRN